MREIVDFHSHILPGIDDGSASVSESIALLRMEAEQGIGHVIATPHFYAMHDSPERFLRRRKEAEFRLREEMAKHEGLPKVSVGAEVYYYRGISDSDALSELTIDKKRCILIEMGAAPWTDSMYRELEAIYARRGLIPIIAHIDRYIGPLRTYGIPKRLEELPVMVQANADFFLHRATAGMAVRMLREQRIHLLGSDCHNLQSRKPNLSDALKLIERRLGGNALAWLSACQQEALNDT